ncbi:MAG: hypothetical protein ACYC9L_16495 [Sulfuricaulis sp.]
MKSIDYSKDYWLRAHGVCALCLLAIMLLPIISIVGHVNFVPWVILISIVGIGSSVAGMGTCYYGHSRIPFVLWLIPFVLIDGLAIFASLFITPV